MEHEIHDEFDERDLSLIQQQNEFNKYEEATLDYLMFIKNYNETNGTNIGSNLSLPLLIEFCKCVELIDHNLNN